MAVTVQDIIDSARYDLNDFETGLDFDNVELLNYMNRMVGLLDSTLSSLRSDLVEAEELGIDTVSGQAYVDISGLNSGLWSRVLRVWIGSSLLDQVSLSYMRYTRMYRSGSGQPTIWALSGDQILFPQDDSATRTDLTIYYDKKTAVLTLTSSMPYRDRFNEFLREALVQCAKGKKNDNATKSDKMFLSLFRQRVMHEEIARGFIPKPYYYWGF
jgi:stalled ribosome alternative rescue factor ArfA